MSSILRPTPAQTTRRLLVLVAAIFAVVAGQAQTLLGLGQSPADFAADSDATLRVAGFAFAIWGPIYLALLIYAVRQALPRTGESAILSAFGWPSLLALLSIGWWIVAAALDAEVATIVLIFAGLAVLLWPLLVHARAIRGLGRWARDRWMTVWPLGLLAGWLSIASIVNLLTVATGDGDLPGAVSGDAWAVLAIVVAAGLGLGVTARVRTLAYPLPIAWGLFGVFMAEQARDRGLVAGAAVVGAMIVLIGAVWLVLRAPTVVERA